MSQFCTLQLKMFLKTILPFAFSLFLVESYSNPRNLNLIVTNALLPNPRGIMPTFYDGEDSIYVLGGRTTNNYFSREVVKYSVSGELVESMGGMVDNELGSGVWAGDEDIFYFGGSAASGSGYIYTSIWKSHSSKPGNMTVVSALPCPCYWTTSIWDHGNYAYIIGGFDGYGSRSVNTILKFSKLDNSISEVGQLPSARHMTSAVWDSDKRYAYIFGGRTGSSSGYLNDILKYESATNTVEKLNVSLPVQIAFSCAVWDGNTNTAYIIGGTTNTAQNWPSVLHFNPATNSVTPVEVNNFPDKLYASGCAFVEKLNRIYIIGGYANGLYRREIMYIDLEESVVTETEQPSTTPSLSTTTRRPVVPPVDCTGDEIEDGELLPNPYCCESFYQCDNKIPVLQHCPDSLQFNPITSTCEYRDLVKCGTVYQ